MAENTPAAEDNEAAVGAQEESATTPETQAPEVPESFRKELETAHREAARYRTERNELRKDAQAWRDQQEAEKTELEKAQEALTKRDDEFRTLEAENMRLRLSAKYGIAEENFDLLGTGTEEELEERAKRISELQAGATRPPANVPGRPRVQSPRVRSLSLQVTRSTGPQLSRLVPPVLSRSVLRHSTLRTASLSPCTAPVFTS